MFKNQFLEGKSSVLLFTSLSAASDLKSGPVFFSQLNVSPAVVEIIQLHLFKNYFHHCNHHFCCVLIDLKFLLVNLSQLEFPLQ